MPMTTWPWTRCRRGFAQTAWHKAQRRSLTSLPLDERFNILFLGRDKFSCSVLRQLHAAKDLWQEITVVTQPDHPTGRRGNKLAISPLKLLGHELNLAVHAIPWKKSDFKDWVPPAPFASDEPIPKPNHLLVTASFGRILRKKQLDLFSPGRRLNVHPSLLPHYRGPAPIQHALLNGDKETGVCVIEMLKMKEGPVDSGDIWGCENTQIAAGATFSRLGDILGKQGGDLLVSVLRKMSHSKVKSRPQEVYEELKVAPMISAANSSVDPKLQTADQIVRISRSLEKSVVLEFHRPGQNQEAGGTLLQLHQPEILLLHGSPVDRTGSQITTTGTATSVPKPPVGFGIYDRKGTGCLIVGCRDETYLGIRSVKQESRALLDAREWWNGINAGHRPIRMSKLA